MWILGALFEQKRFSFDNLTYVVLWKKGELFYKNPWKRSVLESQFQNPQNRDEQHWLPIHDGTKKEIKYTLQ